MRKQFLKIVGIVFLIGCSEDISAPPRFESGASSEPISTQMVRAVPTLKSERFSNLLNFENPSDAFFVSTNELHASIDSPRAHTGQSSLHLSGNAGQITVKLASLLRDRPFPDKWALVGAYFYSENPAEITATCNIAQKMIAQNKVTLLPREWTAVMVDLSSLQSPAEPGAPSLSFNIEGSADAWCDDVFLIDNTRWILGSGQGSEWSICQYGFNYICAVPDQFLTRVMTSEASPVGWRLVEANALRARFTSNGKNKNLTIYRDGRSYWDGEYRPLAAKLKAEPLWQQQQNSPAEIEVPENMGRVDRSTEGDANNDGYNEARGSYQIVADGPRLQVKITPAPSTVFMPTLEIVGLPAGNVLVTLEGQLIEKTVRLEDGKLLAQIPARIERPAIVELRVEETTVP